MDWSVERTQVTADMLPGIIREMMAQIQTQIMIQIRDLLDLGPRTKPPAEARRPVVAQKDVREGKDPKESTAPKELGAKERTEKTSPDKGKKCKK